MSLIPVWFKGLNPELAKYAEETLGETQQVKEKALEKLKKLIYDRSDIYCRLDEVFLLRFLRTKKYHVHRAYQLLLNYYTFREKMAGSFTGLKPSEMKNIIDMDYILYSPYRLPPGSHVAIFRMGSFDVKKATAQEFVAAVILVGEMILDCEATQVCGAVVVFDMKGMTISHYTQFMTFPFLSLVASLVHDCLPERLKSIHFVNTPYLFNASFKVFKSLLKKKIQERIQVHGQSLESLHSAVPKEFLPKELGGHLGPSAYKDFKAYVYGQESFIEKINKYGYIKKATNSE